MINIFSLVFNYFIFRIVPITFLKKHLKKRRTIYPEKYFYVGYKVKASGNTKWFPLGKFIPGQFGVREVEDKLTELNKTINQTSTGKILQRFKASAIGSEVLYDCMILKKPNFINEEIDQIKQAVEGVSVVGGTGISNLATVVQNLHDGAVNAHASLTNELHQFVQHAVTNDAE